MKNVHFTLQGKGGVGKSLVSSLLAQYLKQKDRPVICIDTDPVNATFAGYKALDVRRLELMESPESSTLVERNFDQMMEWIVAEDADFVVDNGSASFIPLTSYMIENDAFNMLSENGVKVFVHCVITGGQSMMDTLNGLNRLADQLPQSANLVVWLNEYFGAVESKDETGQLKSFEEMKVYQRHKARIHALVRIPRQTQSTFGQDFVLMLERKQTFAQIAGGTEFGLMTRQRLQTMWKHLQHQMGAAV